MYNIKRYDSSKGFLKMYPYLSMKQAAEKLDMGIGRNKLFEFLRKHNVLGNDNLPYQKYIDAEYFDIALSSARGITNYYVTRVRDPEGLEFIRNLLLAPKKADK